ncbi:PAAR domain-containing protein [Paraburkholderia pallida]|uniref:PAAR domain-containing protein n=1 Tax=Paraburkholderia pallida TaxID=2547399 RepID=UPI0018D8030A|nr:PAAR domain-containing protein [Paraburkholderia pallida]
MSDRQECKHTTYAFASVGSRTERGGWIDKATTTLAYRGLTLACIGDIVRYDDSSEATIIDGAGFAAVWNDKPFALVGSRVSNGDRIIESLQDALGINVHPDIPIAGLFDSAYVYREDDRDGAEHGHA